MNWLQQGLRRGSRVQRKLWRLHLCAIVVFSGGLSLRASASDATISQNGPLNIFLSVQNDLVNSIKLNQHGGRNITTLQQYGYQNSSRSQQNGYLNANGTLQVGPTNYSDIGQIGNSSKGSQHNNAAVIQFNNGQQATVYGVTSSNGPSVNISQAAVGATSREQQQFVANGVTNFATVYHTGGVNIITVTPNQLSFGTMGRGH